MALRPEKVVSFSRVMKMAVKDVKAEVGLPSRTGSEEAGMDGLVVRVHT